MALARRRSPTHEEDEGYFVSMTDMMVGMLFLFILMLMFFAMKFNEATTVRNKAVERILSAEETRAELLENIRRSMQEQGITVEIDPENGILRLPENILFDRGKADLSGRGKDSVRILSRALGAALPCYATIPGAARPYACPDTPHTVEAVFVEGHTDGDGGDELNWNLSVRRALTTFQSLADANPDLLRLENRKLQPILSVSGYGKQRPVRPNDTDDNKRFNRRIDLRFIMATPKVNQIEGIERRVEENYR